MLASFTGSTVSGVELQPSFAADRRHRHRRLARRLQDDLEALGLVEIEARELAEAIAADLAREVLQALGGDPEEPGAARARQAVALLALAPSDRQLQLARGSAFRLRLDPDLDLELRSRQQGLLLGRRRVDESGGAQEGEVAQQVLDGRLVGRSDDRLLELPAGVAAREHQLAALPAQRHALRGARVERQDALLAEVGEGLGERVHGGRRDGVDARLAPDEGVAVAADRRRLPEPKHVLGLAGPELQVAALVLEAVDRERLGRLVDRFAPELRQRRGDRVGGEPVGRSVERRRQPPVRRRAFPGARARRRWW